MSCAIFYANLALLIIFCILALAGILRPSERFSGDRAAQAVLLYMDGCPHCHRMIPAWHRFSGRANAIMVEYQTPEGQRYLDLARSAGIFHGFPCVFAMKNGNIASVYNGDRSEESLLSWYAGL